MWGCWIGRAYHLYVSWLYESRWDFVCCLRECTHYLGGSTPNTHTSHKNGRKPLVLIYTCSRPEYKWPKTHLFEGKSPKRLMYLGHSSRCNDLIVHVKTILDRRKITYISYMFISLYEYRLISFWGNIHPK